jgi:cell division protein FtsI/penicillin-binding protein 2
MHTHQAMRRLESKKGSPTSASGLRRAGALVLSGAALLAACQASESAPTPPNSTAPTPAPAEESSSDLPEAIADDAASLRGDEGQPLTTAQLTLDAILQEASEGALDAVGHPGAAVVLDARRGDLLAIHEVAGRQQHPARSTFAPASTVKPFLSLAALEHGGLDPDAAVECNGKATVRGQALSCFHVHGALDLDRGLATSCNVYFYRAAEKLAAEDLSAGFRRFGFGSATGLEIPEERGQVPSPENAIETLSVAIGHGAMQATPLQMARAYAGLATGSLPEVGLSTERARSQPQRLGLDEQQRQRIVAGLIHAVETEEGSGRAARIEGLRVAGKTGTSEAPEDAAGKYDAWFAGFAPAEDPQVVVVVLVEGPGTGPELAAPVAGDILHAWHEAQ